MTAVRRTQCWRRPHDIRIHTTLRHLIFCSYGGNVIKQNRAHKHQSYSGKHTRAQFPLAVSFLLYFMKTHNEETPCENVIFNVEAHLINISFCLFTPRSEDNTEGGCICASGTAHTCTTDGMVRALRTTSSRLRIIQQAGDRKSFRKYYTHGCYRGRKGLFAFSPCKIKHGPERMGVDSFRFVEMIGFLYNRAQTHI